MTRDLSFCYSGSLKQFLPSGGIERRHMKRFIRDCRPLAGSLKVEMETGEIEFLNHIRHSRAKREWEPLSEKWRRKSAGMIVIGIGGSSLGARAIYEALRPFRDEGLRNLFFFENVDPEAAFMMLKKLDLSRMVINVVTKSGKTIETIANLLLILDRLKKRQGKGYSSRIAITTADQNGDLAEFARSNRIPIIPLNENEVGRYSVLGPAGLLPLRYAGLDIQMLISGAKKMLRRCMNLDDPEQNPAFVYASIKRMLDLRGKSIEVIFSYSSLLGPLLAWYAQLLAESSGKRISIEGRVVNEGQTPISAIGTLDQHSLLQLLLEGKKDKIVTFWEIERFRRELRIPEEKSFKGSFQHIQGKTLGEVLHAEKVGTEYSLRRAGVPCLTISIPVIDEFNLGQIIAFLEMQVFFYCRMAKVNPFGQPGVELGKKVAIEVLSTTLTSGAASKLKKAHGVKEDFKL
ncbi:MAG: glucose-6-phosphate isomerase [Acidobacteriota bacterium]